MHVASLHVYPIKGARGLTLAEAELFASGFRHDRRFMLVDEDGVFITQRESPRLALLEAAIDRERMTLVVDRSTTSIELEGLAARPRRRVRVWKDEVDAVDVPEGAALVSDLLGRRVSLVYMPHDVVRPVDPRYAQPGDRVGFADGFPVLVVSLASLADLNARLTAPVPIDRFRANVVVEGGEPFAEERAVGARVGSVRLRLVKTCPRCQVINVDQRSAETSKEPLRTLASYHTVASKVPFGMDAIPDLPSGNSALVRVGDEVVFEAST